VSSHERDEGESDNLDIETEFVMQAPKKRGKILNLKRDKKKVRKEKKNP
jgi:hypothetical protein